MKRSLPIHIVGTGGARCHISWEALDVIDSCDVLFASERLRERLKGLKQDFRVLKRPISDAIKEIDQLSYKKRVGVLVSGDPLFFSIGKNLVEKLGRDRCVIHPGVSIAQAAFAKLKLPWDDAGIISLHGRGLKPLEYAITRYKKIGVYTDPQHNPATIAEYLLSREFECASMCVLEDIGGENEKVRWFSLGEAVTEKFREPNFVVLVMDADDATFCRRRIWFGMPEEVYTDEKMPITKREVRAVVLSRLELMDIDLCMWDIGAGTGSIAVEASRFIPLGEIYAVEKDPQRIQVIRQNLLKFDVRNVIIVEGEAPGALELLPQPDRIFVGGGGKGIGPILEKSVASLKQGGKIVVSCVMLSSLGTVCNVMEEVGLTFEVVEIQVNRSRNIGEGLFLKAQNPVWLVVGGKN